MRTRKLAIVLSCVSALAAVLLGACAREPLRIGFIAPLTGASANIGVEGLKGFSFVVADRNEAGGVLGRHVEVITRDDEAKSEVCLAALQELVADGVRIVVLHTTSAAGAQAVEWAKESEVLLVTHTMSDPRYGGLDDALIHFGGKSGSFGNVIGEFATLNGVERVFAAIDSRNASYGQAILDGFQAGAPAARILEIRQLESAWSHEALARAVIDAKAQALLLIAPGLDAAKTAQALSMASFGGILLLSPWAQDQNLLSYAGVFGNRVFFPSSFNPDDVNPSYLNFKARYLSIFGEAPVMSSVYAVDLAHYLFDGIELAKTAAPSALKRSLIQHGDYEGLQYSIRLNEFGDSTSAFKMLTIDRGVYRSVTPEERVVLR